MLGAAARPRLKIDNLGDARAAKNVVAAAHALFKAQAYEQRAQRGKINRLVVLTGKQLVEKILPTTYTASPIRAPPVVLVTNTST